MPASALKRPRSTQEWPRRVWPLGGYPKQQTRVLGLPRAFFGSAHPHDLLSAISFLARCASGGVGVIQRRSIHPERHAGPCGAEDGGAGSVLQIRSMLNVFAQYRHPRVLTVLVDREFWVGEGRVAK